MSVLIVLFGQENEADGRLRAPAMARCVKAAEVYKELAPGSAVVVLPTGSFGTHFNLTEEPHFQYLRRELIGLGVPPENILPGTLTSNTLQDCTEAWYRFKNGGFHRFVAVTSDYHAARVAFILGRLSADTDAEIEVVPAATPSAYAGDDRQHEAQKVETLRREWVDVIPRNAELPAGRFVTVYNEAGREHQHYDTMSLAVVSALFIVNAFAFSIVPGKNGLLLWLLLIGLAVINLLLWSLYNRMAEAARTARRVLTRMEIEHRLPGFSSNWKPKIRKWYRTPPWRWSMKDLVAALAITLFAALAITALASPIEHRIGAAQLPAGSVNSASPSPTPAASSEVNAADAWSNVIRRRNDNTNTNTNRPRRR